MHEAQGQRELAKPNELTTTTGSSNLTALDLVRRNARGTGIVTKPRRDRVPRGYGDLAQEGVEVRSRQTHDATRHRYRGKRLFDLTVLTLIAVPALIIGIVSALAILIDDGSPVFFRQVRIGRDGQPFIVLKLRTMAKTRRQRSAFPEVHEITRAGQILRRMSIDELPQLINVLRGSMSIVGPRPTLPYQVQRYDSRQFGRLRVQPGLTGLAQVNGRNQMSWSERIEWDLRYVENQSMRLDLKVLGRTVRVITTGDGVSGHPHHDPIARCE
jgi:sugar transferase EpsL